ncbi:MAG: methylated-DNA--[protein]-cysteine S-methyltransferase [Candidatus Puniceispirillaceae bacterium]
MRRVIQIIKDASIIYTMHCQTSVGWFRAVSDGNYLIRLDWNQAGWAQHDPPDDVSRETIIQLKAYFHGKLQYFNLPLLPSGVSQIQRHWLDTMANIPFGTTISYTELATAAGHPKAARAAGMACATNPILIIYPCHRVLRKDGSVGNYSGSAHLPPWHADNLGRKAFLIDLERRHLHLKIKEGN